jgi:tRNA threonylcarbamoyladenosine biosynthesis protein TsaB
MEVDKLNILALDTSSSWGSVALSREGKIVYLSYLNIQVTHSERLMQQIDYGLRQSSMALADLDLLAFSNGPGSFTGVRIGLATLKGICMAKELPLYPVNTLKLLAYNNYGSQIDIVPFIDARMGEVYAGVYDKDMKEVIPPQSCDPVSFLKFLKRKALIVGDGTLKYREEIKSAKIDHIIGMPHQHFPLASALIGIVSLGPDLPGFNFSEIAELEPYYLRKSQAELNKQV